MSTTIEKKYGGFTLVQLRTMCEERRRSHPDAEALQAAKVMSDLLDDVEALQADELLPRLRRIETKIHKIAVKTGVEPSDSTTMTISVQEMADRVNVGVAGYDVTLAQIRRALEEHDVDERQVIHVCTGGQGCGCIATLYLTPRE